MLISVLRNSNKYTRPPICFWLLYWKCDVIMLAVYIPWHRRLLRKVKVGQLVKKIPPLHNSKTRYCFHNSRPMEPSQSQKNLFHNLIPYICEIFFDTVLPSTSRSPKCFKVLLGQMLIYYYWIWTFEAIITTASGPFSDQVQFILNLHNIYDYPVTYYAF